MKAEKIKTSDEVVSEAKERFLADRNNDKQYMYAYLLGALQAAYDNIATRLR